MRPGLLLYKCRRCGDIDRSIHLPCILQAIVSISIGRELPEEWGVLTKFIGITGPHTCPDGGMGIADLIGGDPEK